jgi:hypothetical protein
VLLDKGISYREEQEKYAWVYLGSCVPGAAGEERNSVRVGPRSCPPGAAVEGSEQLEGLG